jgi:hypothetical protein
MKPASRSYVIFLTDAPTAGPLRSTLARRWNIRRAIWGDRYNSLQHGLSGDPPYRVLDGDSAFVPVTQPAS